MKLLFVAAFDMEYTGILSHLREVSTVKAAVNWARTGKLGVHSVLLAANGVGRRRAAEATDWGWSLLGPDAVISTGFCGALDRGLKIADVVSATAVNGRPARLVNGSIRSVEGGVRSIDHIARTAAEKARLAQAGECAVEMEAAAVAERAEAHGTAFSCVRSVTDLAGEDLENDFNSALRPDGRFATIQVLTGALRQPAVRLPELLRLRNRCALAAVSLGDFFADCRF